ncbi:unannotated protein [freshwater metagenome]|uniref:thermospermine synthase n=1 Tax=freshwater metagenome TaxID=449393 RepID=A0A6J7QUS7_9ZZZZ
MPDMGSTYEPVAVIRESVTPFDTFVHDLTVVHASGQSAFQHYVIGENPAFGRMLALDGVIQSTEADEFIYHEGIVQPAMLAAGSPRWVLILGGGEGATAREVLRWSSIVRLDMVDIDAEVVAACREHLPRHHQGAFDDPRLALVHADAVGYLKTQGGSGAKYDVVISDMTDPVEEGPATFCFTREYFASVSEVLTDSGVLVVQAGPVSPVEIALHAKVIRTLHAEFPYVAPYSIDAPCYSRPLGFVLASREPLLPRLTASRTGSALAVLPGRTEWLTAASLEGRLDPPPYLLGAIAAREDVYTDMAPPSTGHSAGWEI